MSLNNAAQEFYTSQGTFFKKQKYETETSFKDLIEFVNLGKIPKGLERFGPIIDDADFFDPRKGQRIFYYLVDKLTAEGIRQRDITSWKRREVTVPNPANPAQPTVVTESTPVTEAEKPGVLDKIGEVFNALGGPDLSNLAPPSVNSQDPYGHIVLVYKTACVKVKHLGAGQAQAQLSKLRQAVAIHVTGLMRDKGTYINDQVMETGRQVRDIAAS